MCWITMDCWLALYGECWLNQLQQTAGQTLLLSLRMTIELSRLLIRLGLIDWHWLGLFVFGPAVLYQVGMIGYGRLSFVLCLDSNKCPP